MRTTDGEPWTYRLAIRARERPLVYDYDLPFIIEQYQAEMYIQMMTSPAEF